MGLETRPSGQLARCDEAMKDLGSCLLPIIAAVLLASTRACTRTPVGFTTTPAPSTQSGDVERTLTVSGLARTYLLHIPTGLDRHRSVPLVFVFHGFAQSADVARRDTGFDEIADAGRFVVVYPNGTGSSPSWNAGGCCGYAAINNVDEAAFVREILSDLGTIAPFDAKRIYATGFANGAMLAYRLACEMSDTFAAIAPIAGVFFYYGPCQPKEPVSLIHVHGLSDQDVPYAGDGLSGYGEQYPPVEYGIATWVQLDGCTGAPQVEKEGDLTRTVYAPCRAGTAVELDTIAGLGHAWPVRSEGSAFSSRNIWDFFVAHPKP